MPIEIDIGARDLGSGASASVVRIVGQLDSSAAEDARRALAVLVAGSPRVVILDLEGLRFVDSRGVGVLLWMRAEVKKRGGTVLMTNLQRPIRKVFDILEALKGTRIFESRSELDAYLKAEQEQAKDDGPERPSTSGG